MIILPFQVNVGLDIHWFGDIIGNVEIATISLKLIEELLNNDNEISNR